MGAPLHTKYRPRDFDEVVGQAAACKQLDNAIAKGTSRAFMMVGPSGTGKTTLARIAAFVSGCDPSSVTEIDAATNTGVDAMRKIAELSAYQPFGTADRRATIIDECHGLSKQAWDSLLKVVEEPAKHMLWFFCTTNPSKVPATIKTRVMTVTLKLLNEKQIGDLVDDIAGLEKIKLDDGVRELIVREAKGSPRQALVNLASCDGITSRKEAAEVLHTVLETDKVLELCRFLLQGGSWMKASAIVNKLEDENPESIRIVVVNYVAAVLKNAKSEKDALKSLNILEAFAQPYQSYENLAPLWLSIGRVLFP